MPPTDGPHIVVIRSESCGRLATSKTVLSATMIAPDRNHALSAPVVESDDGRTVGHDCLFVEHKGLP
jgi:hypothetical protein